MSAEYDGVADMPDNMLNILAVLNALQGADMLHVDAAFNTDFENDPMLYKVDTNADGGKTTTIVIPYAGDILPLLHPMLEAGADPAQLAKMSKMLKPIIDSAYKRNSYFEKKKWQTGIVTIPLPEAAPPNIADQTLKVSFPVDDSQESVAPPTRKTLSDYVGKHRAADADTDGADTTKVRKNVLKDLGDSIKTEVKKLTTKKDKKATKDDAPEKSEKKETAGATSSSESGGNSAGSES